ncbi:MAG: radical SAM protein [Candidatus Aerophobetes bacterium]|nr:radical SAM protein [Candidatus Aerophobetes bacterium]
MSIQQKEESPEYLRLGLGVTMTLGLRQGLFYRDAKQYCANLLMTYSEGCLGNCAYCGLANERSGRYVEKSFIRIEWPTYSLEKIIDRLEKYENRFKRVCISMITNKRATSDLINIATRIKERIKLPLSLLICPTILANEDLVKFQQIGVDRIGIAVDAAAKELFEKIRGRLIGGPHRWQIYWDTINTAIDTFGGRKVGVHLVVGLGETEEQMLQTIQRIHNLGASSTLFSFFPEGGSLLVHRPQPPIGQYRRVQLGRYLIDKGLATVYDFSFDSAGKVLSYGLSQKELDRVINSGIPFQTSGCPGCNRPYANSRPGPNIRNYPFSLTKSDIEKVRKELWME